MRTADKVINEIIEGVKHLPRMQTTVIINNIPTAKMVVSIDDVITLMRQHLTDDDFIDE